jgi:hypothetical protein
MPRFCYCSKIVPGKSEEVREHWKKKKETTREEKDFWSNLKMTGFDSFLQETPYSLPGRRIDC